MKMTTLGLAAGSAVLIATSPAAGTLTGIVVVAEPQAPGLVVCDVYARFSEPDDHLVAACGTASSPLAVNVTGNAFDQHPLPPWPGFGPSSLTATDSGWFITPSDAQGAPDNDGRVLLGRFRYNGSAIDGRMLVQFVTGGVHMQAAVGFCHGITTDPCTEGDLDGNNLVTIDDFLALLGDWGPCGGCAADIDGDGEVGINDFLTLLGNWTTFSVVPIGAGVDADLDGDGVVDITDLLNLLQCHGPAIGECEVADIDADGSVGATDLMLLLANWTA
jgi:hypothetical protein